MFNKPLLKNALSLTGFACVLLIAVLSRLGLAESLDNAPVEVFKEISIGDSVDGDSIYRAESDSFESTVNGVNLDPTKDNLQYIYYRVVGDSSIEAQVSSLINENEASFAGVMYRESLAPGSVMVSSLTSRSMGSTSIFRKIVGEARQTKALSGYNAPAYVRLVRKGDIFSSYVSLDGMGWKLIATEKIPMSENVYIGLALSADVESLASYDDVQIFPLDFGKSDTEGLDAGFQEQSVPSFMLSSGVENVRITMKNTGEEPWSNLEGYSLTYIGDNPNPWSVDEVSLSPLSILEKGDTYTFDFDLKAPAEAGSYPVEFRMSDGEAFFGQASERKYVNIVDIESVAASLHSSEFLSSSSSRFESLVLSRQDKGAQSNGATTWHTEDKVRVGGSGNGVDAAMVIPFALPA
ncbi:hypothetical protein MLD52_16930, partial [Puniceicoccaceae bacterium K14]|nr:hypothetical protein [Puniceicoccaceae bacterium K14]